MAMFEAERKKQWFEHENRQYTPKNGQEITALGVL